MLRTKRKINVYLLHLIIFAYFSKKETMNEVLISSFLVGIFSLVNKIMLQSRKVSLLLKIDHGSRKHNLASVNR